jgi:tripartite-type tricarboxylate transporter receptor subunit TctC
MQRRHVLLGLGATVAATSLVRAQPAWPTRPIQLVVPFAAGGLSDLVGRVLAINLEKKLGQPVVVVNRPGAGGAIGTASVARAAPDGYTLLMALTSHVVLPEADRIRGRKPAYELGEFKSIARVSYEPTLLMGRAGLGDESVRKLVERAKQRTKSISYASTGYYANGHISMEGFAHAAGVDLLHVPYQGGGQAVTAVAGGQVDLTTAGPATAASLARSGKLLALGVLGDRRLTSMPEVPTLKELGYDTTYYVWSGLLAPAETPRNVIDVLRGAVRSVTSDEPFVSAMARMEAATGYLDAPEFDGFLASEAQRLSAITRRIGPAGE